MGFFSNLFKSDFAKWVKNASHKELSDAYEIERQNWIKMAIMVELAKKHQLWNALMRNLINESGKNGKMIQDVIKIQIIVGQMLIAGIGIDVLS